MSSLLTPKIIKNLNIANFIEKCSSVVSKKREIIFPIIFLFVFILQIIFDLRSYYFDWDLDNNLYFGDRLLNGELLWQKEFHDKFPFVQYIFSLGAIFHSIKAWIICSICLHLLASLFFYKALKKLLSHHVLINQKEANTNANKILIPLLLLFDFH